MNVCMVDLGMVVLLTKTQFQLRAASHMTDGCLVLGGKRDLEATISNATCPQHCPKLLL